MRKLLLILIAAAGIGAAAAVGVYSAKSPTSAASAECCGDITCPPMCPRTPR